MKKFFEHCHTLDELKREYRRLAMIYHPDCGGTDAEMQELNAAYEEAMKSIRFTAADAWNDGKPGAFGDPSELDDMTYYHGEPCHLNRYGNPIPEDEYRPKLDEDGRPYEQYIFSVDVDDSDYDESDLSEIRAEFLAEEAKHNH